MKKILIISSNRLGDCILTSGLINHCIKTFCNAEITFACGVLPSELFKYSTNIKKIIVIKKKKNSMHWFSFWPKVFFIWWDTIFDLRGTGISYFLFSKKRVIRPFFKEKKKKLHKVISISRYFGRRVIHPNLEVSNKEKKNAKIDKSLYSSKNIIAIAPGANWVAKTWPKENFILLIKKLHKNKNFRDSIFMLIGSKDEYKIGAFIKSFCEKENVQNLIGKPTLIELYFFLKRCKLFLGNDSGLMHLSALVGIPTIGLFGPSDKDQYHPWGKKTLAISTPESPEILMGNKNFSHKDSINLMQTLSVESVVNQTISFFEDLNNAK